MNPNFKPEMITPKLLKACEEQVQKYFGERDMDDKCLICDATSYYNANCYACPLSEGDKYSLIPPCCYDPTFVAGISRLSANKEQLLARGNRLIEILDQHGIAIIDKEVK